jgi:glycerophosphoryl diester phosphodiesterase
MRQASGGRVLLVIGALLAGAALAGGQPVLPRAPLPPVKHRVAVIAHRGAAGLAPENTLAAYRQAIALGVDYIEIDVRMTRDRQFVALHDATVDRTTNGTGAIADLRLAEARRLDAGAKFGPRYRGERIPTLEEVLELCQGRVGIYLDHKAGPVWRLARTLRQHDMYRQVLVYAGLDQLRKWKRAAPVIPVMPSPGESCRTPDALHQFLLGFPAEVLDGGVEQWSADLVRAAHAGGAAVYVDCLGIADTEAGRRAALAMGVDGIQTDHPDQLLAELKQAW